MRRVLWTWTLAAGLFACSGRTIFAGSDIPPDADSGDAAANDDAEAGKPELECSFGRGDCDREPTNGCEVDLRHDRDHCGGCGDRCSGDGFRVVGAQCDRGLCMLVCDGPFYADCDRDPDNGCEAFVWEDDQNCGQCGIQCACHDGRCVGSR